MHHLEPFSPSTQLSNDAILADYASASYHMPPEDEARCLWPNFHVFTNLIAHGFVVWDDEHAIVSIAGSDDANDAVLDVMSTYMKVGEFHIHSGFALYAALVKSELDKIPELKYRSVILTGHSLGGAAAIVLPLIDASSSAA